MRRVFFPSLMLLALAAIISLGTHEGVAQARPSMELLEAKPSATQGGMLELAGEVKNISTRDVTGVQVSCDFQDAAGKTVRMEHATLATDPLSPNKTSEFKCSTKYSPDIKRFNVTFAEMFGGPLVTKDSRKK